MLMEVELIGEILVVSWHLFPLKKVGRIRQGTAGCPFDGDVDLRLLQLRIARQSSAAFTSSLAAAGTPFCFYGFGLGLVLKPKRRPQCKGRR